MNLPTPETNNLCDTLLCGDTIEYWAHSYVLSCSSPYFHKFFLESKSKWSPKQPCRIPISMLTNSSSGSINCVECVYTVITYMYTGKTDFALKHLYHLLNLSLRLEVTELVNLYMSVHNQIFNEFLTKDNSGDVSTERIPGMDSFLRYLKDSSCVPGKELPRRINQAFHDFVSATETTTAPIISKDSPVPQDSAKIGKLALRCTVCLEAEFEDIESLKNHQIKAHPKLYRCNGCLYSSYKIISIINHVLSHCRLPSTCPVCSFSGNDDSMLKHLNTHKHMLPFTCQHCSRKFKTKVEWESHKQSHTQERTWTCEICSSKFLKNKDLLLHKSLKHTQGKYLCEQCGFSAPFKSLFRRHLLSHSLPFLKCEFPSCQAVFKRQDLLQLHMVSHSTKAVIKCSSCLSSFSHKKNYIRHMKTKHGESSRYTCSACDFSTTRLDKLNEHKRKKHKSDIDPTLKSGPEKNPQEANVQESSSDRLVESTLVLSETTGELSILRGSERQPIPVASLRSTSFLTIGNFREGTGSVTLNEATGILTLNNINSESTGAVFLNESTGELSYINLNDVNQTETPKVEHNLEPLQLLDEATGEFLTPLEPIKAEEDSLDSFDLDVFNEDSCDGFDEFDGFLFDPTEDGLPLLDDWECPVGQTLDEATGEFTVSSPGTSIPIQHLPFSPNSPEPPCNIRLNEQTGEFN